MTKKRSRFISVAAAARKAGRSPDTIRRWWREGVVDGRQAFKPGGWIEIDAGSLEKLMTDAENMQ